MKIYLKLPGGGELHYEKEPMDERRFEMICWLVGITLVGGGILKFFSIMAGS